MQEQQQARTASQAEATAAAQQLAALKGDADARVEALSGELAAAKAGYAAAEAAHQQQVCPLLFHRQGGLRHANVMFRNCQVAKARRRGATGPCWSLYSACHALGRVGAMWQVMQSLDLSADLLAYGRYCLVAY